MEGVGDLLLDGVVDGVDLLPDALQVEAALHDLDPQMVFLVDHEAEFLGLVDGHGPAALALGLLAADEVPLDQQLAIDAFQFIDGDIEQVGPEFVREKRLRSDDAVAEDPLDLHAVLGRGPADEGKFGQVPRQADPAADDDVGLGAVASEPLAAGLGQFFEFHGPVFPGWIGPLGRLLGFDMPNLIAEFGGPFVVLVLDRFLHFPPQADQLGPLFAAAGGTAAAACRHVPTRREHS